MTEYPGDQPLPWWQDHEDATGHPAQASPVAGEGDDDPALGDSPHDAPDDDFSWAYEGPSADAPRHYPGPPPPPWSSPPGYGQPWYGPPPRRRRGRTPAVAAGVAGLLVAAVAGGFAGYALTSSHGTTTASTPPSSGGQGSTLGPGAGSGSGGFPFSGGSGNTAPPAAGTGPSDAAAIASRVDPGLVDVNTVVDDGQGQAAGTGMVLTASGEVLTNNHVIEGASAISVTDVGNGKTYSATVLGYSVSSDVAVLQLAGASGLQTVTTASTAASVGEQVVGIGNAGGTGGTPSYAGGTVTATDQSITASDQLSNSQEQLTGMIETNADIQAGDSGGPLVNDSGQVIGMDTAGSTSFQFGSGSQGNGFAIPIATATSLASQIVAGHASSSVHVGPTAFLGILVGDSTGGQGGFGSFGGNGYGSNTGGGVPVGGVVANTPAADAGLAAGDVITSVGGHSVTSQSALQNVIVTDLSPGQVVTVQYTDTAGQQHSVTLTLASGPAD